MPNKDGPESRAGEAPAVWRGLTQAELDAQYDQTTLVPNLPEYAARWAEVSAETRADLQPAALRYGEGSEETLYLYAGRPGAPVHMHVHGGAWRAMTRDDVGFVVRGLGAEGATVAVLNFSLVPDVTLHTVVDQVRRAALFVRRHVEGAERLFVSGHSSGAHLSTCLLDDAWRTAAGLPRDAFAGFVLVSGPYDLEPVRLSARNSYLNLSPQDADLLSPIRRLAAPYPPIDVYWGGNELEEFKRQSRALAQAVAGAGSAVELPNMNHFDMYDAFGDPESAIVRAALMQMRVEPDSSL